MIMIKNFGDHIDSQEVKPEHEKQFLRHGWVKAPAGYEPNKQTTKTEKLSGHVISPEDYDLLMKIKEGKTEQEEETTVKNKGGRPKKTDNDKND